MKLFILKVCWTSHYEQKSKFLEETILCVPGISCLSEYFLIKFSHGLYMILKIIAWSVDDTKTKADPASIQTLFHVPHVADFH